MANLTTKLDAVNTMLGVIGELPVNSLGSGSQRSANVVLAENVLDETNREVQSEGFHFNTEHKYTLRKDGVTNQITLPLNTLRVDTEVGKYTDIDIVQRGTSLYDRKNHTSTFDKDLEVSIVFLLEFAQMPEQFRNYVAIRAGRKFAGRFLASSEIQGLTIRDEIEAKARALDSDSETADLTIFDNYSVYRVLDRNNASTKY
jgi:hypothetical protein|tara:strand:- start:15563 stop:16168 length:606 start_codon:yes stop_codon:yes gene_type:complete